MNSDLPIGYKLLTAGTAACFADFVTFPLDTAKVRLQVQGEARPLMALETNGSALLLRSGSQYQGLFGTMGTIAKEEGSRALYNGLSAGLQRQMCFASIRLGLYDHFKNLYQKAISGDSQSTGGFQVAPRVLAGLTTGGLAVLFAQPTDVVKVRFQAYQQQGAPYTSTLQAYRTIAIKEGARGLWKGTIPNVGRNAIVNVAEIVCYDIIKELIIKRRIMDDSVPCHFTSAVIAGFCATVAASPVDVVKTRYMNSPNGRYSGALEVAIEMITKEGPAAFYKGFTPSFCRLVSWNIVLWITYEQLKRVVQRNFQDN